MGKKRPNPQEKERLFHVSMLQQKWARKSISLLLVYLYIFASKFKFSSKSSSWGGAGWESSCLLPKTSMLHLKSSLPFQLICAQPAPWPCVVNCSSGLLGWSRRDASATPALQQQWCIWMKDEFRISQAFLGRR